MIQIVNYSERAIALTGDTPPGLQISKFNLKPGSAPGEQGRKNYERI